MQDALSVNRGFHGVLFSFPCARCPISFNSATISFPLAPGRWRVIGVRDGQYFSEISSDPIQDDVPASSPIYRVSNGLIFGKCRASLAKKLCAISDFIAAAVSDYYSAPVRRLYLAFAVDRSQLFLLRTSGVETFSEDPDQAAADRRRDLEGVICDQIAIELQHYHHDSRFCITRAPSCGPPRYYIPKKVVLLFRLGVHFPSVGDNLLWELLRVRIPDLEAETVCCVECYHSYCAANKIFECRRRPETVTFEMKPQLFQPLEHIERMRLKKQKLPIACTDSRANDPYSFVINLVEAPYDESPFPVIEPPKPEKRPPPPVISKSLPKWVSRLSGLERAPDIVGSAVKTDEPPAGLARRPVPYYLPATSYSLALADRSYAPRPFDITMLDAKRKKGIHSRNSGES
jgi:hypothetical protein